MHFPSRSIEADGRGSWADTENYGGLVDRESLNFTKKEDAPVDGAQIKSMHRDFLKGDRLPHKKSPGAFLLFRGVTATRLGLLTKRAM